MAHVSVAMNGQRGAACFVRSGHCLSDGFSAGFSAGFSSGFGAGIGTGFSAGCYRNGTIN